MYGLPVELPFSTAIMLRSIADIARSEGEDLDDIWFVGESPVRVTFLLNFFDEVRRRMPHRK